MKMRGGREAGACTKFRLLMWKNFLQQWRHRGQTVIELFLPVLTMSLVLILRSQIEPVTQEKYIYPSIRASSLTNSSLLVFAAMNFSDISIAYSPRSEILDDILRSAIANLLIENADELLPLMIDNLEVNITIPPDINLEIFYDLIKTFVPLTAYNSSNDLKGVYAQEERTRAVLVAVEFDDSLYDSTDISTNMTYALRFPEIPRLNSFFGLGGISWRTDTVFPYFEVPGPRLPDSVEGGNDPGYVNEMFIALQQVISTELISRMTGGNSEVRNFEVHINRYPHPPFLEDLATSSLQFLLPIFIIISFGYTAVNMVRAITIEKEMELKEIMKIMGLPTWLHWTAWFCKQFIYLFIMTVLLVILLKVNWFATEEGFSDYAVLTNTPWTVVFFFFMLYLTSTIFFCFMLSSCFSRGNTAAMFTGVIWFLTYIPALLLTAEVDMSTTVQMITCLFVNSAMGYGIQLLVIKETTGGIQWGEFMSSPSPDSPRFLFGHVVLMLLVDCVLYMLLALYLEQVFPGPYGTPKPWYFPFQLQFWCPKRDLSNKFDIVIADSDDGNVTKESDPTHLTIGVKVSNLTKVYGTNVAVNNLSLNIYDDQITVLLGHNGAGKSTTISMLTGNLEVTRGSVTLAGYDITKQTVAARAHLGLCPQHNVLFNELTVREHLEFFAKLKGFSGKDLDAEIEALIEKLELQDKRDQESRGLSGGQKRRLCVGIALSGAARVVLLDEPTSGMDPASRRALWDLLQKEKEGRTVILTTHFMDEADILGDRVAIMAHGRLQCVGSPYFLKQHYGVGYTLVVVKMEDFQTDACTRLINKYIPDTTVKEDRGSEITYSLSNDHAHLFEEMLTELESNIDTIKFKNYGLIATTLEDVFMSVGSDTKPDLNLDPMDESATTTDTSSDDVLKFDKVESLMEEVETATGYRLYMLHVTALWLKLGLVWSRSRVLLLLQLLTPVLIMASTLGVLRYLLTLVPEVQPRLLTLEQGYTRTETLLNFNGTLVTSLGRLATAAYKTIFNMTNLETMGITVLEQPIEEYYLERGADPSEMSSMRHSVLTGATFGDASATAWFSNFGYHDVAASLHAVHAALLAALRPGAELRVYNHPLETQYNDRSDTQLLLSMLSMQMSLGIGNSVGIVSGVYIMFYIRERVSRAKLLQKAAGVDPAVLWGSAATFDWFAFLIICAIVVATCAAFNVQGLNTPTELGRIYLCLIMYGAAMLPLHYLCSHLFKGPALGFVVMYFVNSIIGMMGAMIVEALSSPFLNTEYVSYILDSLLQFFPLYSLVTSVRELLKISLTEFTCMQSCESLLNIHPNITSCSMESMCGVLSMCCGRDYSHFEWEEPGVGRYLFCMMVSCAVFWLLLLLVEYRVFQRLTTRKRQPPPLDESQLDEDVVDEARHVQRAGPRALAQHCLVASGLSKYYGKHLAVDQISFTVSDSECFGLLGVNGAGKTTTFKMLMGDEAVSSGDAFVCGHSVKSDLAKVHENIGYCPQFDAVFGELTGRENLRVFAQLRGYPPAAADARAALYAEQLGFGRHIDEKVSAYSGGTKRKLSTAIALVGGTRLVFVDEPTTGVDPAAKRQVWRALRAAQRGGAGAGGGGGGRRGRGVVLTSHSMEECEALCSRLTIMVNGRFQCLGTPQHLKNKYSQGFTLTIKMKIEDDVPGGFTDRTTEAIKNYVNNNFTKPRLMEEYQGLLTYYLPERSVPWSKMFGIMERAKRERGVEDYSISQTTLEQIFLQFTKYQQ